MKKLLIFIMLITSSYTYAQSITVTGTVKDGTGPLLGVNVIVENTTNGVTTDFDGNFTLNDVSPGSNIVFSYLGYKTQTIRVNDNTPLTINLEEDAQALDEVVVIGYGTQKKREVTGAVSTVSADVIDEILPVKVEQALQGTVSGVNVTTQSGSPGAGIAIRIRGIATNGNNSPYVIIDGYEGDLSILNPTDIETITVLKDAQAAIYGTIGANGVILITTKSGKRNTKPKVSYNAYSAFQQTTRRLPLLNTTEYALLLNESYAAGGQAIPFLNVSGLGGGTNWQNEIFDDAAILRSHDINVSGGSEKVTYAFSASDLYQEGIIGGGKSSFKRNTARLSLGADISDKIKIKTNVIYTYLDRDALNESGLGSILFNAVNTPPTLSPYNDQDGDFTLVPNTPGLGIEIINPLAQIYNTFNDYDLRKLNGTVRLDYDIFKNIKLTGRIGFNTSNSEGKSFSREIDYGGKVFDITRSSVSQNSINDNSYTLDIFSTYRNVFKEDHSVQFTLGTTIYKEFGNGLFATGFDVPNNSWDFADIALANGVSPDGGRDVGSYAYDERRLSFFSRVQYDYKGKYLLSTMLRRDLSTKFGPDNRVGYFPSVTAGWVLSDETFFEDTKAIDFLKLRVSYGILGNDRIPNNGYVGSLSGEATYVFDDVLVNGTAIGILPNPELQWEEAKKFDVGADIRLLENKLEITTDYFINTRDNLLIPNIPVSGISGTNAPGAGSPTINAGSVRNTGFELAVSYRETLSDELSFGVNYNITTLKNEVTAVNNGTGFIEGGGFGVGQLAPSRMEVGFPIGYFYGLQTDGIFQNQAEVDAHPSQLDLGAEAAPGDIRYVDSNGDGVITVDDRINIGDPIPDVTMGFNFNINYKNFDFTAYAFASLGNDLVRNYERTLSDVNRLNYNLNRWTGEGTSTTVPRVTTAATTNNLFSDYFVEDGSYMRLQNMQFGFTFPTAYLEKAGITKLRMYVGANNLVTLTKYRGFDPGVANSAPIGGGIDGGAYPTARTYLIGFNLNF